MQKRAVALHFCREKRPAGKRQDVLYIHERYYSRGKRILQDLHCINISVFLPEELVILRTAPPRCPRSALRGALRPAQG